MTDLYRHNGSAPAALPPIAYDEQGNAYTPPYAPDDLAMLGFVLAPPKPADTETQTAQWDAGAEKWVMVDWPPTPDPEPVTLSSISDRQFFQALASAPYNLITQQEALDAVKTGEIPPIMQAVVDALPLEQQFPVTMILSGGIEYERHNDLVEVFGASQGMTPPQIDDFWRFAQAL